MKKRVVLANLLIVLALSACGKKEGAATAKSDAPAAPTTAPAAPAGAAPAPAAVPVALGKGEETFKKTCAMCHQTGAAGAPKVGDKADWGPRIAQGAETLYKHAIGGFNGTKGAMPPKGANAALSDEEVKAAVDFMVSKAQ